MRALLRTDRRPVSSGATKAAGSATTAGAAPGTPAQWLVHSGMRITTARVCILSVLAAQDSLDFHGVCRALETRAIHLPPGTVHRVLCDLSTHGLVQRQSPAGTPGVHFALLKTVAEPVRDDR